MGPFDFSSIIRGGMGLVPDLAQQRAQSQEVALRQQQMDYQRSLFAAKQAEAEQAKARQAAFQGEIQGFLADPTAQSAARLQLLYPEFGEQIKSSFEMRDKAQQDSDLRDTAELFAMIKRGKTEDARKRIQGRIEADRAAGQDTSDDEDLLETIGTDPNQAAGSLAVVLASVGGVEKFAGMLEQLRLAEAPAGGEKTALQKNYEYLQTINPQKAETFLDNEIDPVRFMDVEQANGDVVRTPYRSGNAGGGSGGTPRGIRNNNEGNIKDGPWARSQPGYAGSDGTFAKFDTPANGALAQSSLLSRNYLAKGFDTPAKIVARYAPSSENSAASMGNYATYIARKLGIGPNDKIAPSQVGALQKAMAEFENGQTSGGGATQGGGIVIKRGDPKYDYRVVNGKLQRRLKQGGN